MGRSNGGSKGSNWKKNEEGGEVNRRDKNELMSYKKKKIK